MLLFRLDTFGTKPCESFDPELLELPGFVLLVLEESPEFLPLSDPLLLFESLSLSLSLDLLSEELSESFLSLSLSLLSFSATSVTKSSF